MKSFYMASQHGSSVNMTFEFGEYKVSIAADNSCNGFEKNMVRFYIAVLYNNDYVTNKVFTEEELISSNEVYGSEENLLTAIEYCKVNCNI